MNKLIPMLLILASCNPAPEDKSILAKEEMIRTDTEMSAMAITSGFNSALLAYAGDSLVKPEEGKWPVIGKKALEALWAGNPGSKTISWEPYKAEVASSGDLGYTLGNWKLVTPDTTYYGNYFTAWKKGTDGKWKWVVDGGNNTPAPR